eukprot:2333562-Rhodomonas_salina.1
MMKHHVSYTSESGSLPGHSPPPQAPPAWPLQGPLRRRVLPAPFCHGWLRRPSLRLSGVTVMMIPPGPTGSLRQPAGGVTVPAGFCLPLLLVPQRV